MILFDVLIDGAFAAVAGVGFGIISDPPLRALKHIAILAALGHALRFSLMHYAGVDIATGSFAASLLIGLGSLPLGKHIYCPMTVLYIPALLPMIPGMFAYKIVFSLIMFFHSMGDPIEQQQYIQALLTNGLIAFTVIFNLAVGATIPIFLFSKKAYSLTRRNNQTISK
ncbi:MAG: threonine/serine exporter family protein [Bacteroidaceae bacterium]|nr:threonine/serine exporter family protein [Bacteroidaceae bacterium]